MSTKHWFVEALAEIVDDAKAEGSKNTLCGLRTALEIFLDEATLTADDRAEVQNLILENTDLKTQPNIPILTN
ncbi:hypothetical protein [uncultured Ruegeria sp.]|uniref:hypothetical protein n=1 Tax=uncultured Ruegeria sp. TaxID=259304 RepID=UPI002604F73B|nr:hypothetical protein [uncultured Ruegeria sp.]